MNILVTGSGGFLGRNLLATLKNIRDGKESRFLGLHIDEIFEFDLDSTEAELEDYCARADFVFNLAGVNRPKDESEFMKENFGFASHLLDLLKLNKNKCPVMLSSSIQAALEGRFSESEYGRSKLFGEELFFKYGEETGAKVLVYRFPNIFGKWCRPNYNSVIATFCHNFANDLPIQVNDPDTELTLVYVDDIVEELVGAILGQEHCDGKYCFVPLTYKYTLGQIVDRLEIINSQRISLVMPDIPEGSFEKKLYATYLSYLPEDKVKIPLKMNEDLRGSFTEVLKTFSAGQFSVNVSKPGVTKGQHWHHSKWEFFIVVSGRALIRQRRIGSNEVMEFEVSGDRIEAVHMLPGYTHNITNLDSEKDLITLMWASESFDPKRPDTFREEV